MFSAGNMNFSAKRFIEIAEEGTFHGEPDDFPEGVNNFIEKGWWSIDELGEHHITRAVPGMSVYFHIKTNNIPDGDEVLIALYEDDNNEKEEAGKEGKDKDDHKGLFNGSYKVSNGKIVVHMALNNLDSFINNDIDKLIELYFRCSYKEYNVKLPSNSDDYLVVGSLVIDRYKMPGLNPEGTDIAEDLTYGTGQPLTNMIYYTEQVVNYIEEYKTSGLDEVKHGLFTNKEDLPSITKNIYQKAIYSRKEIEKLGNLMTTTLNKSEDSLWLDFRLMKEPMVWGDLNDVLDQMIAKFKKNEGGIFENDKLTERIKYDPRTRNYCRYIENYIAEKIKQETLNNVIDIEDKEPYFGETAKDINDKRVYKDKIKGNKITSKKYNNAPVAVTRPSFPYETLFNLVEGSTLALNDIWATEVILKELKNDGEDYTVKYQVTLWDHFGLNISDMEKFFYYGAGFRAWFVLQHLYGYKPFVTKITFEKEFKGNINEGREERLKIQKDKKDELDAIQWKTRRKGWEY